MTARGAFSLSLPESPAALAELSWEAIAAFYDGLARVPITPAGAPEWLAAWSRLESLLSEAASRAMIAYTCDTGDPAKERAHLRFSAEIMPRAEEQGVRLARHLVESGLEVPGLEVPVRRFRSAIELFRDANVPLFSQLEELGAAYQRATGRMTAEWDGTLIPLPRLSPFLQSADRTVRERAFRASTAPYLGARDELAGLFDRMYRLRQQVAANAGLADFREYSFRAKCRFDYTAQDCARFHDAVEAVVVPAVSRLFAEHRARLGVAALRPWDLALNPYRAAPLRPYETPEELPRLATRVFGRVEAEFGVEFQTLIEERLLDLESREGKAPGGYCDTLHVTGRPFIFMNASGVVDDVMTLLHEAGHAFHAFAAHRLPYIWQRHPGAEASELASMGMELLAVGHLARPHGSLSEEDARRVQLERLEDALTSLTHIASVDAFQHWIYTSGQGDDPEARDAEWLRLRRRFEPDVDWAGLDRERTARWYRQLHIFLYPFYYIEYGLAQLGALQVWRNQRADPAAAVRAYREFLALGATQPLPALYAAAGARLVFEAGDLAELVTLVETEAAGLRAGLPPVPGGVAPR